MDRSDSGLSTPEMPSSGTFARPMPADGPKTVINPERRGVSDQPSSDVPLPVAGSSIWNRLFPPENLGDDRPALSPEGLELGHFTIEERIGVGGMGAVFRALDTRLQRVVALKVLAPAQSRDSGSVQRFKNEARAAAKLDHDNIARVFYIGDDQGLNFIAFEYITGTNVRDLIRERGRLEPADAVNYILQIASALRHTSAAGVVHRDIKPSNIIITTSGRAKLVDLGLARKETSESADLTLAGTTLGTFDYISPEQAKDPRNVDVRSDIYSLGCTFYHMLTGEPPYPEGTVLQKLLDHQGKEPPDPAKKNRHVSDDLSAIVRKMMASDPRRRYATPDQLIQDLMLVAGQLGLRSTTPDGLVWRPSQSVGARFWERNLGWITAIVILLVISLASGPFSQDLQKLNSPSQNPRTADADPGGRKIPEPTPNGAGATGSVVPVVEGEFADTSNPLPPLPVPSDFPLLAGRETKPRPTSVADGFSPSLPAGSSTDSKTTAGVAAVTPLAPAAEPPFGSPDLQFLTDPRKSPPGTSAAVEAPGSAASGKKAADNRPPARAPDEPPRVAIANSAATTASKTAVTPEPPKPLPQPPAEQQPIAVIGVDGVVGKSYRTLEAACAEAEDGSVIELRYDGSRREIPIKISKKKVTIRAARGFQPTVEFIPEVVPAEGFQTRMIEVAEGSLNLINVSLVLKVPSAAAAEHLALFHLQRPDQIRLQKITLTVESPLAPVSIVELVAEPGQMLTDMKMMTTGAPPVPVEFEIEESLVRGNGDFIAVRNTRPVRFSMKDTVVALDGSLLHVFGGREPAADNARLELRMEHVSCVLGKSLVKVDSGDLPNELIPVHVTSARNNIFAPQSKSAGSLISMSGNTDDEDFRRLFLWNGERNFYDQYTWFWMFPSGEDAMDFEKWKQAWGPAVEVGARNDRVIWNEPLRWRDGTFNLARLIPSDVALNHNAVDNPAAAGATDGSDAGAGLMKLPDLPLPVTADSRSAQ